LTDEVTFTPEVSFVGNPTPIVYNLIEKATGLGSAASIAITYKRISIAIIDPCNWANPRLCFRKCEILP
jgi:hypothetical protein